MDFFANGCFLSAVIIEGLQTLGGTITHSTFEGEITDTVIFVKFSMD